MPRKKNIREVLDRIDWDFPRASTSNKTVHALHWFPGNFIPEIPSYFIHLLSEPGDLVLDCFCGSGTTGIEALKLGRRVWQSDVNLASLQVARGKVAAITESGQAFELERLLRELTWDALSESDAVGRNGEGAAAELSDWIEAQTLRQLRFIWGLIELYPADSDMRFLLEMLFTDTLFKCAGTPGAVTRTGRSRRHHWGWIADNVRPVAPARRNAIVLFRNALIAAGQVVRVSLDSSQATIRREDVRTLSIPPETVNLVVTSPPYAGVIDYALANRLTYLWMGWALGPDREAEIGSRRHRTNLAFLDVYLAAMSGAVDSIVRALRPRGYCALVIGASRRFPEATEATLSLFGKSLDLVWGPRGREPQRRRVSDRRGRPATELVCVFQRI